MSAKSSTAPLTSDLSKADDSPHQITSAPTQTKILRFITTCSVCGKRVVDKQYSGDEIPEDYRHEPSGSEIRLSSRYPCRNCGLKQAEKKTSRIIQERIGIKYFDAKLEDGFMVKTGTSVKPLTGNILDAIRDRIKSTQNFYITGPMGCGKTRLAAALIREIYLSNIHANINLGSYLNGYEFRDLVKPGYDIWDVAIKSDLVIIDELIAGSEFVGERVFHFIDERYRKDLMTIGISNLSRQAILSGNSSFGADFGPKIISRLTREGAKGSVLELAPRGKS